MVFSNKGISNLIATVFMILLTISLIAIIAGVIIPFVKNNLNEEDISCIDAMDKIRIVADGSCYDAVAPESRLRVRFGNVNISKVYVVWENAGDSESIEKDVEAKFLGGGVKTFKISGEYERASVGALINQKRCAISDNIELLRC